jgi:1-deoxyxylulose-5-phosphate synthase
VRYPAISNYASWQVCEVHWISEKNGYKPPYVSQPMYNLLARNIEQEYVAFCKRFGISNVIYNPLAGGLLTGKQQRERPIAGTRFDNNQLYLDRYWHPVFFDAVDELQAIAQQAGRSMIDLSLSWLLHHSAADCVILGASRVEQLEENLDIFERGPLEAATVEACNAVWRKVRGVTPPYNRFL